MSLKGAIDARGIWKRFRADRRRMLLRDELSRLRARLRGQGDAGWRWALRDVELVARPGESIGLVGVNGSGKSTLLKILSHVMYPYAGRMNVSGRIGALIEVRAGIHPDLTGRENAYLYGSILGLRRREVARRFDDIVGFAELEDAIDRQVKFYSSGMQMRLGFAVAAFLEPDVLLVDEVLAVGDSTFQQRCLDKMRMTMEQGTTVVFVSHDLPAVEASCARGVWLHDGVVRADGPVREILQAYRRSIEAAAEAVPAVVGLVRLTKASLTGRDGTGLRTQEPLDISLLVDSSEARSGSVCLGVSDGEASPIFLLRRDVHLPAGESEARCSIPHLPLPRGRFYLWVAVFDGVGHELLSWHPAAHFDVVGPDLDQPPRAIPRLVPIHVDARWEVERR
jgi:ABC-type polysaccharide/polyol phosphate transport system ATPase subunit